MEVGVEGAQKLAAEQEGGAGAGEFVELAPGEDGAQSGVGVGVTPGDLVPGAADFGVEGLVADVGEAALEAEAVGEVVGEEAAEGGIGLEFLVDGGGEGIVGGRLEAAGVAGFRVMGHRFRLRFGL